MKSLDDLACFAKTKHAYLQNVNNVAAFATHAIGQSKCALPFICFYRILLQCPSLCEPYYQGSMVAFNTFA